MIEPFSVIMFVALGFISAHIAHKVSEGKLSWPLALALGLTGSLIGGLGAAAAGVVFYDLLGHMFISGGCALLSFLIWRKIYV